MKNPFVAFWLRYFSGVRFVELVLVLGFAGYYAFTNLYHALPAKDRIEQSVLTALFVAWAYLRNPKSFDSILASVAPLKLAPVVQSLGVGQTELGMFTGSPTATVNSLATLASPSVEPDKGGI